MTASVLKKRSKTHKRLEVRILIGRNRTKRASFRGSPLFQAPPPPPKKLIQLILSRLDKTPLSKPAFANAPFQILSFPYLLLGAQDQRLGAKQDQFPCGSTGTFSGNCQETETCMVRACHTPQQPLQNHLQDTSKDGQRLGRQRKC